jgi:hypothetical protein
MAPRKNINSFENAVARHEKIVEKRPIGRAALLNSIDLLESSGKDALRDSTTTINDFADTMYTFLAPVTTAEYTKPPLSSEQLANIAGKLGAYQTIVGVQTPEVEAPQVPTDTKKLDTSKRKA